MDDIDLSWTVRVVVARSKWRCASSRLFRNHRLLNGSWVDEILSPSPYWHDGLMTVDASSFLLTSNSLRFQKSWL